MLSVATLKLTRWYTVCPQVKVKHTDVEAITSTLTILKVRQEQSGNYTCMPSNLHAASVVLHVINGTCSTLVLWSTVLHDSLTSLTN